MKRKQAKQLKLVLGIVVVLLSLVIGISAMQDFINPYKTVTDAATNYDSYQDKTLQVEGYVVDDTTSWDPVGQHLEFDMTDGTTVIHVLYDGKLPGTFPVGQDIGQTSRIDLVAIGTMVDANTIQVQKNGLLVKCPSKYEQELE